LKLGCFKKRLEMKDETKKTVRELGYFASLGMSIALSIVIGLFLGRWLDSKFDTDPVFMFIGLAMGIAAGFSNILRAGRKSRDK
jgi:ATP synthase protein I